MEPKSYPQFVSHKEVGAVKITHIEKGADGSLHLELEGGFDTVIVPHAERNHKPHPEVGWYLIQYKDGYISFSPPKAFEEGYEAAGGTDIDPAHAEAIEPRLESEFDDGQTGGIQPKRAATATVVAGSYGGWDVMCAGEIVGTYNEKADAEKWAAERTEGLVPAGLKAAPEEAEEEVAA